MKVRHKFVLSDEGLLRQFESLTINSGVHTFNCTTQVALALYTSCDAKGVLIWIKACRASRYGLDAAGFLNTKDTSSGKTERRVHNHVTHLYKISKLRKRIY